MPKLKALSLVIFIFISYYHFHGYDRRYTAYSSQIWIPTSNYTLLHLSRAVTGLLTGRNTLRRHVHVIRLSDIPLCRRCGAKDETSAHILCECEALASLRHAYLCSFFLEPEDIKSISMGVIWKCSKATGLPQIEMGHKGSII